VTCGAIGADEHTIQERKAFNLGDVSGPMLRNLTGKLRVAQKGARMSGTSSSTLSNSAIAEYAERVGAHHGIYNEAGKADVKHLVELLGGRVEVAPEMFAREALSVHSPGQFTVHLPPITSDRRDRFTIAHELGHYFLHYLLPNEQTSMTFGRGNQNRAETEANLFGASMLMPAKPFARAFETHGSDWWQIGEIFGVSPQAANVRAQVLGLGG
jgi:hypothetical protein